jgi:hypothetical protein
LVAGNSVFSAPDPALAIANLKHAIVSFRSWYNRFNKCPYFFWNFKL